MMVNIFELIALMLLALVGGMYWGPWLALTRSIATFEPQVFLAVVKQLNANMGPLMTVLLPVALLSTLPVLFLSYSSEPTTFYLTLIGLLLFIVTLVVTMLIEVPIVKQIDSWTVETLPDNWTELRDRWTRFHLLRVIPAVIGIGLLLIGVLW